LAPVFCSDELVAVLRLVRGISAGSSDDAEKADFLKALSEQIGRAASAFRLRRESQEAEYALEIQRGLLPRDVPQVPGFSIAGSWQPAMAVAGDYYDVLPLADSKVGLVVADVCGKGIPAALLMANLQATVKAYATAGYSPAEVCRRVNRAVAASITGGKFITMVYAVLDAHTRRLTYCNAGHNPPLVVRTDGSAAALDAGGAVLGIFQDLTYEEGSIDLDCGDRLVIFTDGIVEAANPAGEPFGDERLLQALKSCRVPAATALRDTIMAAATQFCNGEFADDATLLTVVADGAP
jgi:sigma-B regulation protein RsbU (phosphoserine phosphatase)